MLDENNVLTTSELTSTMSEIMNDLLADQVVTWEPDNAPTESFRVLFYDS